MDCARKSMSMDNFKVLYKILLDFYFYDNYLLKIIFEIFTDANLFWKIYKKLRFFLSDLNKKNNYHYKCILFALKFAIII